MGKALLVIFTIVFLAVHLGALVAYLLDRHTKDHGWWDGRGGW